MGNLPLVTSLKKVVFLPQQPIDLQQGLRPREPLPLHLTDLILYFAFKCAGTMSHPEDTAHPLMETPPILTSPPRLREHPESKGRKNVRDGWRGVL